MHLLTKKCEPFITNFSDLSIIVDESMNTVEVAFARLNANAGPATLALSTQDAIVPAESLLVDALHVCYTTILPMRVSLADSDKLIVISAVKAA